MSTLPKTLIKVTCLSIALLGATAVVTTMMVPDAAYAKNDKAKDKGNGNGTSNDKSSEIPRHRPPERHRRVLLLVYPPVESSF